jgi:hypothetical protein
MMSVAIHAFSSSSGVFTGSTLTVDLWVKSSSGSGGVSAALTRSSSMGSFGSGIDILLLANSVSNGGGFITRKPTHPENHFVSILFTRFHSNDMNMQFIGRLIGVLIIDG